MRKPVHIIRIMNKNQAKLLSALVKKLKSGPKDGSKIVKSLRTA